MPASRRWLDALKRIGLASPNLPLGSRNSPFRKGRSDPGARVNLAASPLAVATLSFATAAAVTTSLAPMVRRFGLQLGLTDKPDPRKQHNSPMVRLGGIAMVFGFLLALSVIWGLGGFGLLAPERDQLIWSTLAGSLCFFCIGFADDLFELSPWPRLIGQFMVAGVIWSQGVRIGAIDLPWLSSSGSALALGDGLSLLATVVWLVGITNAINWLDGLDGLAAGVAGIAAVGLISVSFSLHQVAAGFLAAALAGCCLGFLRHNFNPARIFMGMEALLSLASPRRRSASWGRRKVSPP